jgi:hypothetical protein
MRKYCGREKIFRGFDVFKHFQSPDFEKCFFGMSSLNLRAYVNEIIYGYRRGSACAIERILFVFSI